jgi:hypothetical protein
MFNHLREKKLRSLLENRMFGNSDAGTAMSNTASAGAKSTISFDHRTIAQYSTHERAHLSSQHRDPSGQSRDIPPSDTREDARPWQCHLRPRW